MTRFHLVVASPDRPGIVAAVSAVIAKQGGNIATLDQFTTDPADGIFVQRTAFDAPAESEASLRAALDSDGATRDLEWALTTASPKRVAILASKTDHCLLDLLWRQRRGENRMATAMVISNHTDVQRDVESFDVPFHFVPSRGPDKSVAEEKILELLAGNVDLVVFARYMQIVSSQFIERVGVPIINIHHSFLPAFIGAGPYAKAKARGVKLVGATAHYVTEELDEGPIIEQDVVRVSHADSVRDLQRRGADIERAVLSRAVAWHCDDRVIRVGNTTVVFPG